MKKALEQYQQAVKSAARSEPVPEIIAEDSRKREVNVKNFLCSDGSYIAAVYAQPVHYEKDGKLEGIDNTLVSKIGPGGKTCYINKANSMQVQLPEIFEGNTPVTVTSGGKTISWTINSLKEVNAKIKQPISDEESVKALDEKISSETDGEKIKELKNHEKMKVKGQKSSVIYESALADTDIIYDIQSAKLKERIVLHKIPGETSYAFDISCGDLTAELRVDNSVCFYEKSPEEAAFVMQAPYMTDASEEAGGKIGTSLEKTPGGYRYTITPDRQWLEDENRAYPVTIDPTINVTDHLHTNDTTGSFTPLSTYYYNYLNSSAEKLYLKVGRWQSGDDVACLVYIPLPSCLTASSRIINTRMVLNYYRPGLTTCSSDLLIHAYKITSAWNQDNTALNNTAMPSYDGTVIDYAIANDYAISDGTDIAFDITKLAQSWQENGSNYGILLRGANIPSSERYARFYDSEHGGANDPNLIVSYRDSKGIEPYWTYTTVQAGNSGAALVNNYNGHLVVTQPVASAGGGCMPVSIEFVYNGCQSWVTNMGIGWRSNFHMSLGATGTELTNAGYPYVFTDADGTEHYFYQKPGSTTEWIDEDGLGYTLTIDTSNLQEYYILTDKNGGKIFFRSSGYLVKISDTNGNFISITYELANNAYRIQYIYDGADRQYAFLYYAGTNTIQSIVDPAGRSTQFIYSGNYLREIDYPDGKTTVFNDAMTSITNTDGTTTAISYTASTHRVASIRSGMSESSFTERYSFAYRHNATDITDGAGRVVTYQFNNYGQTVGVVNHQTGQAEFYESGAPGASNNGKENKLLTASKTQASVTNLLLNSRLDSSMSSYQTHISPNEVSTITWDSTKGHMANGSIKVTRTSVNSAFVWTFAGQDYIAPKSGYYTLSAYINTNGATLTDIGGIATIEVRTPSWGWYNVSISEPVKYTAAGEWIRISTTAYALEGYTVRALVGFHANNTLGTAWFDDLQLEEGEVANSFNILENTNFTNGSTGWSGGTIATEAGAPFGGNVLKLYGSPTSDIYATSSYIKVNGSAGDVYSYGCWAKANSVSIENSPKVNGSTPLFQLFFFFFDSNRNIIWDYYSEAKYNHAVNDWQFISGKAIANTAYSYIQICLSYDHNANSNSLTAPYIYKEEYGQTYSYDANGNISSVVDLAKTQASFAFKSNQLNKLLNPTGSEYLYTHNPTTKNIDYAHSTAGQRYAFTYDSHGNPVSSTISVENAVSSLTPNKQYYLFNAYSGNILHSEDNCYNTSSYRYNPNDYACRWQLLSTNETDVYNLKCMRQNTNLVLEIDGSGSTADGVNVTVWTLHGGDSQRFKILANGDGTFRILTKKTGYTKCVDGQPGTDNTVTDGGAIQQYTYNSNDYAHRWYFVEYNENPSQSPVIQTSAGYSSDGNFMTSVTDARGKTSSYTYNSSKGLLAGATDPNGNTTQYTYNSDVTGKPNNDLLFRAQNGSYKNEYVYDSANRLTSAYHNNNQVIYGFTYDSLGRRSGITVGNGTNSYPLSSYTYNSNNLLDTFTYGNNNYLHFTYDTLDRITQKQYNGNSSQRFEYVYNADGNLGLVKDYANNTFTFYTYDMAGRIVNAKTNLNNTFKMRLKYEYESKTNRLSNYTFQMPNYNFAAALKYRHNKTSFTYGSAAGGQMPDAVYGVSAGFLETNADNTTVSTVQRLSYAYDGLGRRTSRTLSVPNLVSSYSYVPGSGTNATSALLQSITNGSDTLSYTYDDNGNITQISQNGTLKVSYAYDSLNQLTRENNTYINKTKVYAYDLGGNITSVTEYAYTTGDLGMPTDTITYGYGNTIWKDLLTSYDGQTITYDNIGNPLTYRDGLSFTWQNGRQLASASLGGSTSTYMYDDDGVRTQKVALGVTTIYYVQDGQAYGEFRNDGYYDLVYLYDENGGCYGITCNGIYYYFVFNGQGDVIRVINSSGTTQANYAYDSWGKLLSVTDANGSAITSSTHIGNLNPFRYRGYHYDRETGLYYLQSRYYDPTIGRFINADSMTDNGYEFLGTNMFVYCLNNPVEME